MMGYLRLLEIQPGGWLLLSALCFFGDLEALVIILGCVVIHEMGHLLMLQGFGVRVRKITFDITGLCICYNEFALGGIREIIATAAGPCAGLLVGVLASFLGNLLEDESLLLFAGGNAILSVFNLLPAKPLDGWRILNAFSPAVAQVVSVCTALAILAIGLCVMFMGYGTALAFMGILLLMQEQSVDRIRYGSLRRT